MLWNNKFSTAKNGIWWKTYNTILYLTHLLIVQIFCEVWFSNHILCGQTMLIIRILGHVRCLQGSFGKVFCVVRIFLSDVQPSPGSSSVWPAPPLWFRIWKRKKLLLIKTYTVAIQNSLTLKLVSLAHGRNELVHVSLPYTCRTEMEAVVSEQIDDKICFGGL